MIVAVLLMIFLWGPQKLPEMARAIGLAKAEFERAAKEASSSAATIASTPKRIEPPQDPVIVAAKNLGIITEGKTKEELAKEIVECSSKK